jgi:YHS domain-containing protein
MTMMQNQNQRGGSTSETPAGANRTGDDASWIDPVCGMNVKRLSAFFTAEHGGATYRFCSESCRGDFEKDPARFTRSATPAAEH